MSIPDPERLLSLVRAFNEARVLLTASELDLFSELAREPATASALAERRGFILRPLTCLLDALTALGLLEKSAGTYSCTVEARALLDRDSPTSILPMMLHQAHLWQRWSALTSYVDPKRPSLDWSHWTAAFIGAMHAAARAQAPEIAAAVGVGAARRLLDVGGASGTYTEAFLATSPELRATIFDRPEVVELARERLAESPYVKRITLASGDFLSDPLPAGHDLALLSAIIHSCSPEEVRALFRAVWEALVPGGRIVIRDYVMNADRTAPLGGALFAVNMLVNSGGGSTYTCDEIRSWLEEAGFERVQTIASTETMSSLVEALRP
jgi:SAM-dependent methyltransferase